MRKRLTFLSAIAVSAVMALPLRAEPAADTVVAQVNGAEITLGHVILARLALPQQYQQLPNEVLYGLIVEQLIQQTVLEQSRNADVPKRVQLTLDNEKRSLLASEVIEAVAAEAVTDAAVQAAYDERYSDGFGGDEFHAAHILVETEDEAKAIKAELDGGADFATLAKEKSTGPSGPSGGDLGWFGEGRMVAPFEAAVVALSPGQISDPVETQFGWHVIILNETRKSKAPELDEVRAELAEEIQQQAIEIHIDGLLNKANVERTNADMDPSVLENLDLVRN